MSFSFRLPLGLLCLLISENLFLFIQDASLVLWFYIETTLGTLGFRFKDLLFSLMMPLWIFFSWSDELCPFSFLNASWDPWSSYSLFFWDVSLAFWVYVGTTLVTLGPRSKDLLFSFRIPLWIFHFTSCLTTNVLFFYDGAWDRWSSYIQAFIPFSFKMTHWIFGFMLDMMTYALSLHSSLNHTLDLIT